MPKNIPRRLRRLIFVSKPRVNLKRTRSMVKGLMPGVKLVAKIV